MKRVFFAIVGILLVSAGCSKSDNKCAFSDSTITALPIEITTIQTHLTNNSLTATQHSSGLFYNISNPGSGTGVSSLCNTVTVRYVGRLLNGTVFDSSPAAGVQFQLGQLIAGWQKGIPLIKRGGSIKLYVPPSLGYGTQDVKNQAGVVVIPGNSTLVFDIDLLDVL